MCPQSASNSECSAADRASEPFAGGGCHEHVVRALDDQARADSRRAAGLARVLEESLQRRRAPRRTKAVDQLAEQVGRES